ncbi:MAG: dephospho-CoA kinase [Chloroflexi bacterium]|nr:MAG: dephospho-CoA kinase [Chloroflexota bacterium]
MGSGKSTVAAMLRELGAKVLDADAIVHDEQLRGTVGYSAIVQTFGTKVLGEDREIDRSKLAAEVFGDPAKLRRLEQILHLERLASRGMGEREAELRLAQQLTEDQFRAAADAVIVNDGDRQRTRERVREAWAELRRPRAGA